MDRLRDRGPLLSRRALLGVSLSALFVAPARGDGAHEFCGTDIAEIARLLDGAKKNPRVTPTLRMNVFEYLKKVNGRATLSCTEVRRLQELYRIGEFKRVVGRNARA